MGILRLILGFVLFVVFAALPAVSQPDPGCPAGTRHLKRYACLNMRKDSEQTLVLAQHSYQVVSASSQYICTIRVRIPRLSSRAFLRRPTRRPWAPSGEATKQRAVTLLHN